MNTHIICDEEEIIATIKNNGSTYDSIYFFQYSTEESRNNEAFERILASQYVIISNPLNIIEFEKFINKLMNIDVLNEIFIYISKNIYETKSKIAACLHNHIQPKMFGVTGTDGKTSTCIFLAQILATKFLKVGYIGSIGVKIFEFHPEISKFTMQDFYENDVSSLTTPDAFTLHKILYDLSASGIQYATLEVSSHAIAQSRVNEVVFEAIGLTNVTSDHLDYHHTVEEYFATKASFLKTFVKNTDRCVVFSRDIECYPEILQFLRADKSRYITYGQNEESDITIEEFHIGKDVIFNIKNVKSHNHVVHFTHHFLPLFQIRNIACAFGMLISAFFKHDELIELINVAAKNIQNIIVPSGRYEVICTKHDTNSVVIVDYAHTANAMLTLLLEVKNFIMCDSNFNENSKVIIVFGCGGDRDRMKRSVIGRVCHEHADICIITDDNPRSEKPDDIRREIMTSCVNGISIADRQEAIKYGFELLGKNDILVIAGQGCDEYKINNKLVTSDAEEVLKCNNMLRDS
ncbi:UDP-N-acetylmuramoyl-L-alanyl-D-glutamate--2,6-diaminopimelate ligase [Candidatus Fokinia solitaria]|uniref:UDP-N-acetylmuramoyl-L-alanyl-D-glutamate--2, 6-diaminopimelate ligase n=1 Tax=Candidatus Fokinia solitaria TaxID=1802984 RepID=A0A2U8BSL9_9RICK|nr:UDP-N-acetylmuramyl-tripeptide synthetase [Candidatus Fokinia solitaria]AWD33354.1 UDP-N-acetylmuramoyl-L-alanyl-D-glutamate--2,6-diaminopimelate ligase [Candidatus Fokinia solitaria]